MNRIITIAFASLIALSLALTGCNKGGTDSTVLARVNRTKITAGEFKKQLEELQPQMQQAVATDPKARKEFLEDLIGIEVVLQEAKRQGLDKDPEFKKRQEMLKKELERRIQDDTRNELFNALLKKELADKLSKIAPPSDQEARDYYNKNQDKMRTPDGKKLSYKDVEPQLKRRLQAEKQRDIYLEYAKNLRSKAKVTVDEKALDAAAATIGKPEGQSGLELQTPPAVKKDEGEDKKEEGKKSEGK
jgi:peptidyl-prolyl cis-trans isomerase C